jgi:hypothetical protein
MFGYFTRAVVGFVLLTSGLHKTRQRVAWNLRLLGVLEVALSMCALGNAKFWPLVCVGFFGVLVAYRLLFLSSGHVKASCNCGVPGFGKSFKADTTKVLVLLVLSVVALVFPVSDSSIVTNIFLTLTVGFISIVLVRSNPAMRTTEFVRAAR